MNETKLWQLVAQDLREGEISGMFEPPPDTDSMEQMCCGACCCWGECCCYHSPDVRNCCDSGKAAELPPSAAQQPNEAVVSKLTGRGTPASRLVFPKEAVDVLEKFFTAHLPHPYPTKEQKEMLAQETGLTLLNVTK